MVFKDAGYDNQYDQQTEQPLPPKGPHCHKHRDSHQGCQPSLDMAIHGSLTLSPTVPRSGNRLSRCW
jgi:hypothetical protein